MTRFPMLAVVLLALGGASSVRGQDTDEVTRLKKEIELLQSKLETANLKIEKLQKELDESKKGGTKPAGWGTKSLADLLPPDTTIQGDVMLTTGNKASGDWSLKITERDGKKFKGTYTVTWMRPKKENAMAYDVEGTIDGNRIRFSTKDPVKPNGKFTGELKDDSLKLGCDISNGGRAELAAKVAK